VAQEFKAGDHVKWNSEAGRVRGTVRKKHTSEITFKGYTVHASKEEPQYLIKSDKTDHGVAQLLEHGLGTPRGNSVLTFSSPRLRG
jgi:hypothetical protein